jgi:hypothetical protein
MGSVPRLLILLSAVILFLILFRAATVSSQAVDQLPPGFSQALSAVRGAEAAGATPAEIAPLVGLLNSALQLNAEATNASSPTRSQLQAQVSNQLATVQSRAGQLESVASRRTFMDDVISYLSGGVGALIATVVCAYCLSFWRKYRVKRTLQMKIYRK